MSIEIKSIVISIKGREEILSLEELDELKFALDKLYEKKYENPPTYVPPPYQPYYKDNWWEVQRIDGSDQNIPQIYCSNNLSLSAKL